MAVSLNSVVSFNPTAKYKHVTRANTRALIPKPPSTTSLSGSLGPRQSTQGKRSRLFLLAAEGDNLATETIDNDPKPIPIEGPYSNDAPPDISSSATDDKTQPSGVNSEASNGAVNSSTNSNPAVKRATLTARERLRAARVLSRYTDSKPAKKPELGSKLLEALRETDKGKRRPGLPQAPTNLFDDSKRGMPKEGWTIIIPGGMDVFLIVFSFVFISTVMFATTYIVWKVGAIHFNEY